MTEARAESQAKGARLRVCWLALLTAAGCGAATSPSRPAPPGAVAPASAVPAVSAPSTISALEPPLPQELIGRQGRASVSSFVRTYGGDWNHDLYDRLFPKRLSLAACRAQTSVLTAQQTLDRGLVYPDIYSLSQGRISAARQQEAVRFSIRYCTPKLIDDEHQLLRIVEEGQPSLEFSVAAGLQVIDVRDVDRDGLSDLIVEWHQRATPQIYEGARGVLSFANGKLRELFHGRYAVASCSAAHPSYDDVSITVVPQGATLHFDETLWRDPCDPKHPNEDIGPVVLVEHDESTVELDAVAAGQVPTLSAPLAPRPLQRFEEPVRDATGKVVRAPAATPLEAACHGPSNACQCPDFSGLPEMKGRAALHQRGSFSGPYPEALVSVMLCEGHVYNWGGTVLVRKLAAGWVPIGYVAGFVPSSCSSHRGADGLERLACVESYGLNQGTYTTRATVVDFAAKHYDVLSESACEDARDVKAVRWLSRSPDDLSVEVTVEAGLRRDNAGSSCQTVGGSPLLTRLQYRLDAAGYVPTPQAEPLLLKLLPKADPDFALDPAVSKAMLPRSALPVDWPPGLRPERHPLELGLPNH